MTTLVYHIVQHDGGWAYKVGDTFSESFPSHDLARRAADVAAREQRLSGSTVAISWEDERGIWHEEVDEGWDRPDTVIEG